MSSPSVERWIDDYRSEGLIDWPDELRDPIDRLRRKFYRRVMLWAVACVGACVLGVPALLAAIALNANGHVAGIPVTVVAGVCLLSFVLSLPFAIALGPRHLSTLRFYRGVLAPDEIEVFARGTHVDEEAAALEAIGRAVDLREVPTALLVSPGSTVLVGVVLDELVEAVLPPRTIAVRTVATSAAVTDGPRRLTPEELAEIGAHRQSLGSLRGWAFFLVCVLFVGTGTTSLILGAMKWYYCLPFLLWITGLIQSIRNVVIPFPKRRRLRAQLKQDVSEGVALRMSWADVREQVIADGGRTSDLPVVPPEFIERLPNSDFVWTVDGIPAPWRRAT